MVGALLYMLPPPDASLSAAEVAAFYRDNAFEIRLGATLASWISAFGVPFAVVVAVQLGRLEGQNNPDGVPVWSILAFAGGILMTMFLVFPPIIWGSAAFTAERAPELTMLLHELGCLTFVTTDQFFIFQMIPMGIVSLRMQHDEHSAFPRWLGYLTLWTALSFEAGALAFMFKSGPFSWDGLLAFWVPLALYGVWITIICGMILRALKRQSAAPLEN